MIRFEALTVAMKKTKAKSREADGTEEDDRVSRPIGSAGQAPASGAQNDRVESTDEASGVDEVAIPVEQLDAKVAMLEDKLLRAKADFQNLQRRSAIERSDAVRYANAELMKSLLSVLDDFERSLEAAKTTDKLDAVVDGVRLVYDNFMKSLNTHGLEQIKALHEPFDPHVHEAMMQQPSADFSPGTVIEEVSKGYQLRDRVLRPTRVVVSAALDAKGEAASDESQGNSERETGR